LHFCKAFSDYIDGDYVANMIESRWWTDDAPRMVSRLKRVELVYGNWEDARVLDRLEHCRREGLILNRRRC
jgi:esterase/lipase superfamily enzyme